MLLIERAHDMRSHAGQVAFPGGAVDPDDDDEVAAALREAVEETGLDPAGVRVSRARCRRCSCRRAGSSSRRCSAWWREPSPVSRGRPARGRVGAPGAAGRAARPGQPLPRVATPAATSAPPSTSPGCWCGASRPGCSTGCCGWPAGSSRGTAADVRDLPAERSTRPCSAGRGELAGELARPRAAGLGGVLRLLRLPAGLRRRRAGLRRLPRRRCRRAAGRADRWCRRSTPAWGSRCSPSGWCCWPRRSGRCCSAGSARWCATGSPGGRRGSLDAGLGAAVSVLAMLVVAWFLASSLRPGPLPSLSRADQRLAGRHRCRRGDAGAAPARCSPRSAGCSTTTSCRPVFGGLSPERIRRCPPPDGAITGNAAVRRAAQQRRRRSPAPPRTAAAPSTAAASSSPRSTC